MSGALDRATAIRDFVLAGSCSNCRRGLEPELLEMVVAALSARPSLEERRGEPFREWKTLPEAGLILDPAEQARAFVPSLRVAEPAEPARDERVFGTFAAGALLVVGVILDRVWLVLAGWLFR